MKRTLWAAFAVLLGLGLCGQKAFAGGYGEDFYAGADLYIARAHVPVYDCPRPGCRTDIRLRSGSSVYAICWDGGEGWCRVQTRYFKNMFLPRYAIDLAYGGQRYKSYYYNETSPRDGGYKDCYYKESFRYKSEYREGCYDRSGSSYRERGYRYGGYGTEYSYKHAYKRDDYSPEDYDGNGENQEN
jgi:hypothetical protein